MKNCYRIYSFTIGAILPELLLSIYFLPFQNFFIFFFLTLQDFCIIFIYILLFHLTFIPFKPPIFFICSYSSWACLEVYIYIYTSIVWMHVLNLFYKFKNVFIYFELTNPKERTHAKLRRSILLKMVGFWSRTWRRRRRKKGYKIIKIMFVARSWKSKRKLNIWRKQNIFSAKNLKNGAEIWFY